MISLFEFEPAKPHGYEITEALEDFVRAAGNSSYGTGFLQEVQLRLVRDLLNFSMTEIYAGKFCVDIYKVSIGAYQASLLQKTVVAAL